MIGKAFRYPLSGHFQKFKETRITVKEKIFSLKLFSSVSIIPSSINLCGSSYTCQVKIFFYATTGKFPCQVVGNNNWTCDSESWLEENWPKSYLHSLSEITQGGTFPDFQRESWTSINPLHFRVGLDGLKTHPHPSSCYVVCLPGQEVSGRTLLESNWIIFHFHPIMCLNVRHNCKLNFWN